MRRWLAYNDDLPRNGFTLIELAVVITLVSLLVGVVVVKLRGPYRKAQRASLVQRIEQLDQLVRSRARQLQQPGRIGIDLKQDTLMAFENSGAKPLAQLSLKGNRIDRVMTSKGTTRSNRTFIPIGLRGQSPSYALRLAGPNKEQIWLFFTARTGQLTQLESERDVRRLLLPPTTGANSH